MLPGRSMPHFKLIAGDQWVCMEGVDDFGTPFTVHFDRVWAMNLMLELGDFLEGRAPQMQAVRVQPPAEVLQGEERSSVREVPEGNGTPQLEEQAAAGHVRDHD